MHPWKSLFSLLIRRFNFQSNSIRNLSSQGCLGPSCTVSYKMASRDCANDCFTLLKLSNIDALFQAWLI